MGSTWIAQFADDQAMKDKKMNGKSWKLEKETRPTTAAEEQIYTPIANRKVRKMDYL